MRRSMYLCSALAALALCACKTPPYKEGPPLAVERDKLWATLRSVVSNRFEIDEKETDQVEGVLATKWSYDMSFEYLTSFRRMVEAKIEPFEDDAKKPAKDRRLQVFLRVRREINDNIDDPRSKKEADWGDEENDTELENILHQQIMLEHTSYTVTNIPKPPPELEPTTNPRWTQTRLVDAPREKCWDALRTVARSYGYLEKLLQPEVGHYESDWSPQGGTDKLENARERNRLVADVLPETAEGGTKHRVQLRVEVETRKTLDEPWVSTVRDLRIEEVYALELEERLGVKR